MSLLNNLILLIKSKVVLQKSPSIDQTGTIIWQLMIAMLCAWIIVYSMVINGIQVQAKIQSLENKKAFQNFSFHFERLQAKLSILRLCFRMWSCSFWVFEAGCCLAPTRASISTLNLISQN
jgi:hypothetical protein